MDLDATTPENWELLDYLCHALPGQEIQVLNFWQGLDLLVSKELWLDFNADIATFREWKLLIKRRVMRQMTTFKADWNPLFVKLLEAKFGGDPDDPIATEFWIYASEPGIAEQILTIVFAERQPFKPKLLPMYHLARLGYSPLDTGE